MPEMCVDFIDAVRACFHAKASRDVCVDLPKEDYQQEMCGKIKKAMYGAKDAAQNWELVCTEMMVEIGFTQGSYGACAFYHKEKDIRAAVHGGDFTVPGSRVGLDWSREVIQRRMGVKFKSRLQRRRPGAVRILHKVVIAASGWSTRRAKGTLRS
jgi:hypothetical protein